MSMINQSEGMMIEKEFYALIRDIVRSEAFRGMKRYQHHIKGSVYDHSIKVAYLCYKHHKRHAPKTPLYELVRGALLHDYYLYDWHDMLKGHRLHLFTHPKYALRNALQHYPDLSVRERDMIGRHMFPIVPLPPKTRAGWLICFYDKVAALGDYFGENRWKNRRKKDH